MTSPTFAYVSHASNEEGLVFSVNHDGRNIRFQTPHRAPAEHLLTRLAAIVGEKIEADIMPIGSTEPFGLVVATIRANGTWHSATDGDRLLAVAGVKAGINALNRLLHERRPLVSASQILASVGVN